MLCKLIKIITGENVICFTDNIDDDLNQNSYITVKEPVIINSVVIPRGNMVVETHVMSKWIKMAKNSEVKIPSRNIITMVEVTDSVEEQFRLFLDEYLSKQTEFEDIVNPTEDQLNELLESLESLDDESSDPRIIH